MDVLNVIKTRAMVNSIDEVTAKYLLLKHIEYKLHEVKDVSKYERLFNIYWSIESIADSKLSDVCHNLAEDCKYSITTPNGNCIMGNIAIELLTYASMLPTGEYTLEKLF